jgi:DNA-binding NarL/FixJ family response regulator
MPAILPESEVGRRDPIRLLIVDDRDLIRAGVIGVISSDRDLEYVADADTAVDSLTIVQRVPLDLVLVDDSLPGTDPIELVQAIRQTSMSPGLKIVLMVAPPSQASGTVIASVQRFVDGYFLKTSTVQEILAAIRCALDDASPQGPGSLDAGERRPGSQHPTKYPGAEHLTPREVEVLVLVAKGLTNYEIAGRLGLKPGTIKIYVERIIGKLGVAGRLQAAVRAYELGMLE